VLLYSPLSTTTRLYRKSGIFLVNTPPQSNPR